MTVSINVTFTTLFPDIQRHLSIIGKRLHNNKGENLFSAVTLSSAEKDILALYMQQGAQNVVAVIEQFVSNYIESTTKVAFHVTNTRWNDPNTPNFYPAFIKAFNSYLINYTLSEYLGMNFPELAKKYTQASLNYLTAIIQLVVFKAPPAPSDSEGPSVQAQLIKTTVNIGSQTSPQYVFHVPLTDFTNYNIISVEFTDHDDTGATFDIQKPNGIEIVQDLTLPHTFTEEELEDIREAEVEYVMFYPSQAIPSYDMLILNYTL